MPVYAQTAVLERYVQEGLSNNLALKQIDFSLQGSRQALEEAKGMFFPSIGIEARYSRAGGGREIVIPIGDLMNPVYQTINELLSAQGLPPRPFPELDNEIVPFLREEEHETKIRLVQPIFQPSIYYNYRIKSSMKRAREAEREAFRRQLIADIKTAYFNFLKTVKVVELLDSTRELLEENLRVSTALVDARKATPDAVYRARAEISVLDQQRTEAERDMRLSASYFNFMLNRDHDESIDLPERELAVSDSGIDQVEALRIALDRREEIDQVENAVEAARNNVRLESSTFFPTFSLVLDYGIQGEFYRISGQDDFWMGSLLLQWNLFNGFQKKARRNQAVLKKNALEAQLEELKARIELQVREACDNLLVARMGVASTRDRVVSAEKSFKVVKGKYREGISPQIEFLDARNTLTSAEIDRIIAIYDYFVRCAEFERVTGLLPCSLSLE
jgi:outer membrane protein TolC